MEQTRTELHTHLMGMLRFDSLVKMLDELGYPGFPIDEDGYLDFQHLGSATRTKKITSEIVKGLMIPKGESLPYEQLEPIYLNRSSLLGDLSNVISKRVDNSINKVYSLYFNLCLCELINDGIEYVEISFSNLTRIKYMLENIYPSIKEKINVRFLLSTNRIKSVEDMKNDKRLLKKGISNNFAIGFDFMGLEKEFNNNENDSNKKTSNSINSFRTKMDMVIDVLMHYPKSTLRIHAGENEESRKNPLSTLKMIDGIAKDRGIVIPPPEIRLGHAIYFEDCDEYLYLLKKYKVIIEINASSNMALSNIKNCKQINYEYYVNNDIPVVLSTDGAGVYDTSIEKEDNIALNVAGPEIFKKIFKQNTKILNSKRS